MLILWRLQLVWRTHGKKRQISLFDYWSNRTGPCRFSCVYRYENILRIGEVLGHRIDAKISPKAASEKSQTTVSENKYTSLKIRKATLTFRTPTAYLRYSLTVSPNVYAVWASKYTGRPIIANSLLYKTWPIKAFLGLWLLATFAWFVHSSFLRLFADKHW